MLAKEQHEFDYCWRMFDQKIVLHKLSCTVVDCHCHDCSSPEDETKLYVYELINDLEVFQRKSSKEDKLKVLMIYLYNEIAKKPLKAFYELMRLKREKVNIQTEVSL